MTANFNLHGRVALVTGGARGNGAAIADGLRQAGAAVGTVDILPHEAPDDDSLAINADLGAEDERKAAVAATVEKFGRVDILVNCAGITVGATAESYSPDDWRRTMDINLDAAFSLCQLAFPSMRESGGGSIVNVTSLGSVLGFPDNPAYGAAKGGLRILTKALARDWGRYGIRVNNLCPGYIRTAMTEASYSDPERHAARLSRMMLPRWGDPSDLAGPAVFLASDASQYVTGTDLFVDGGWTANGL